MKVIVINGSPRKQWNTAQILSAALDEAKLQGAETKLIHLNDLNFSGCKSCFACKRIGGASFGRCALHDDLKPVLDQILSADIVLFGTPIYFGDVTANMRALFERLWFPSLNYDKEHTVNYTRNIMCGLMYTMGVPDAEMYEHLYKQHIGNMERLVGSTEYFVIEDTMQFEDYNKYLSTMFDAEHKRKRHEEVFPQQKIQVAQWMKNMMEKKQNMNQ